MKKLGRFFIFLLWLIIVALSVFLILKPTKKVQLNDFTILEIWQVDMVEGGTGSRRQYLDNVAKQFEKLNKNVLITVINQTPQSVQENFENGYYPDMISYSQGLTGIADRAKQIDLKVDNFGGKYKNKFCAFLWAMGGYVYVFHKDKAPKTVYVSKVDYNMPLISLYLEDLPKSYQVLPPEKAYYNFLNNKDSALLGTQRDLYRLKDKLDNFTVLPLEKFTDICQYISILTDIDEKIKLSNKFINLLYESGKKDLYKIGMRSPYQNIKSGDNGLIALLFDINYKQSLSPFYSFSALDKLHNDLLSDKINGEEKTKLIKNAIFYL